jgi:hypothetical protein
MRLRLSIYTAAARCIFFAAPRGGTGRSRAGGDDTQVRPRRLQPFQSSSYQRRKLRLPTGAACTLKMRPTTTQLASTSKSPRAGARLVTANFGSIKTILQPLALRKSANDAQLLSKGQVGIGRLRKELRSQR